MRPVTVAIDGPAASGKSTIGYHLAQWLGYVFLDTGVLYRAVTWAVQAQGISVEDEDQVNQVAREAEILVKAPTVDDGRQSTVLVDRRDVTWALRSPQVEQAVSPVSAYPGVRTALTARMRAMAREGCIVMVGRDIGTVVIPDADLKLYVVASPEVRAQRRYLELQAKGEAVSLAEVLAGIRMRDRIDSGRRTAPLRAAADAITLDTTDLTIEAMFAKVEQIVDGYDTEQSEEEAVGESG